MRRAERRGKELPPILKNALEQQVFGTQSGAEIRTDDKSPTLTAAAGMTAIALENHPNDSRVKIAEDGIVQALSGRMGTGGGNTPMILEKHMWQGDRRRSAPKKKSERERYIVRRLTPLECERLQGFPDGWTDIGEWTDSKGKFHKESSDSARYAALGNSIALPSWFYVLSKLSEFCEEKTMASLFDGISGFNVCWARINGRYKSFQQSKNCMFGRKRLCKR